MSRIIDKDIDFWTATVETHASILQRCATEHEHEYRAKRHAAKLVLEALENYRDVIDSYAPANPSSPEPFA